MYFHTAVLRIEFAQTSYIGVERSGFISVKLLLNGGVSASDIHVTVTSSDQSPLSAEGKRYVSYTKLWVWMIRWNWL